MSVKAAALAHGHHDDSGGDLEQAKPGPASPGVQKYEGLGSGRRVPRLKWLKSSEFCAKLESWMLNVEVEEGCSSTGVV